MVGPVSRDQQELGFEGIPHDVPKSNTLAQLELDSINRKITQIITEINEKHPKTPYHLGFSDISPLRFGHLEEAQVPKEIEDPLVRKYMVLMFNTLGSSEGALCILRLPMSELMKIYIDDTSLNTGIDEFLYTKPIHGKIRRLVTAYLRERSSVESNDFIPVIKYLRALITADVPGDLDYLSLFCLNERKQLVEQTIEVRGL